jgi:hypothetical protein
MNETEKENTKPHADPATQEAERDTPDVRQASVHDLIAALRTKAAEEVKEATALEALAGPRVRDLIAALRTKAAEEVKGATALEALAGPLLLLQRDFPDEVGDQAQQSMFRDIDAILARLEIGIAAERTAMDALLDRLTSKAA